MRRATVSALCFFGGACDFYPRSPCGERPVPSGGHLSEPNFYPRSPCGERHCTSIGRPKRLYFYPRSPCGERLMDTFKLTNFVLFLSTLSLRRATYDTYAKVLRVNISIHALLAESDCAPSITPTASRNFYPRSPCGERQALGLLGWLRVLISIHALLAESDERANRFPHAPPEISIHALLAESDPKKSFLKRLFGDFYPRSPCGERPNLGRNQHQRKKISIHALLAESDGAMAATITPTYEFLSTLSLRRATDKSNKLSEQN